MKVVLLGVCVACLVRLDSGAALEDHPTLYFLLASDAAQDRSDTADVSEHASSTTSTDRIDPLAEASSPDEDNERKRRSGGIFSQIKSKLNDKTAGLLGKFQHPPAPEYGPPLDYGHKTFNIFGFKKAIFGALLQAIKAITGGVIALKGQLLKVKGHLVAAKGNLLQTKGEAISNFGRHIATKALLTPPTHHSSSAGGTGYGHSAPDLSSGYGVPPHVATSSSGGFSSSGYSKPGHSSAVGPAVAGVISDSYGLPPPLPPAYGAPDSGYGVPSQGYGAPHQGFGAPSQDFRAQSGHGGFSGADFGGSLPGGDYGAPLKRGSQQKTGLPDGVQAGLLILKPVQVPSSSVQTGSHSQSFTGDIRSNHQQQTLGYNQPVRREETFTQFHHYPLKL